MQAATSDAARRARSRRLLGAAQTAVTLMVVWLALSGLDAWPLGLGFALLGAAVGARWAPTDARPWRPQHLPAFAWFFLVESLRGGLDVARRALHPRLPLAPRFVSHVMRLPAGQPRTLMVSVVSLLPGTLSADLRGDGTLLVHVLAEEAAASVPRLETHVARLFGVDAPP
jgi:multicomponent Na+:H+ antiporter subunit E